MSEDLVSEARAQAFVRIVRGMLAEVDRLRDGGSMASAPRKDAAPTAAEPAVLHASIDPPAIAPVDEPSDETLAIWAEGRFCDETSAMLARALARRRAADSHPALRQKVSDYLTLPVTTDIPPEPRCRCTHRWAEHYGPCQRPGCGCLAFVEPESQP